MRMGAYRNKVLAGTVLGLALACSCTVYGAGPGWEQREDGWYYLQEDGRPVQGWVEDQGRSYYLLEDGRCLMDTMTPDGYYVDGSGAWYERTQDILGVSATAPGRFAPLDKALDQEESLSALAGRVEQAFKQVRRLRVTKDRMEYMALQQEADGAGTPTGSAGSLAGSLWSSGTSGSRSGIGSSRQTAGGQTGRTAVTETVLIGLYQEPLQGRYRLDIKTKLYPDSDGGKKLESYDYGVFRAMLYQISSSPEILEDALLSAWQADNRWKICRDGWVRAGDAYIKYMPGNGYGRFLISPASAGDPDGWNTEE